ncbi:PA3496 family putative envelope integrity protein [Aliivibrio fischeri]|uniref:PA3496 family putative envelope integrity protein n=1 Tax=Aliivibrio fischeri TaxID=668 RepID=UPI00147EC36A|nr:hypothetical protein [Aliivibrio fischeri]
MLKTSDNRHVRNAHLHHVEYSRPRVKVDKNTVLVRRSIEDIQERRQLQALFEL